MLGFIVLIVSNSVWAGYILPDLSRSQNLNNESPIAVGFSHRKVLSGNFAHAFGKQTSQLNSDSNDNKVNMGAFTFSYYYEHFSVEGNIDAGVTKVDASNSETKSRNFEFETNAAFQLGRFVSLGIGINETDSKTEEVNNNSKENKLQLTPIAIGVKLTPSFAIGAGIHLINTKNTETLGQSEKEFPTLYQGEFFIGAAYGVDQRIGHEGFGTELVYLSKEKDSSSTTDDTGHLYTIAEGSTKSWESNSHYLIGDFDFKVQLAFSENKSYDSQDKTRIISGNLVAEYLFPSLIFVAPNLGRVEYKAEFSSSASVKSVGTIYGLRAGMRTKDYELALSGQRNNAEVKSLGIQVKQNSIAVNASVYF